MGVSYRSIVIGLILIPLNCLWLALTEVVWYTGEPTTLSIFPNVIFLLCVITAANALVGKVRPRAALSAAELLVIYVMLTVCTGVAGHDMIEVLIPSLVRVHRYFYLDGRYANVIPHIPAELALTDRHALQSVYLGQESIYDWRNLQPWLQPLAWWFGFVMALCAVLYGLNLVFRKQWTEHEKLAYPIIQVPMLVATEARRLVRSRPFWIAFGVAGGINVLNGLNALFPLWPKIPIVQVLNLQTLFTERPWVDMGEAWVSFYPSIIALCFFMPLDLAFSAWFFFILFKIQGVMASHFGMQGMPGFPFMPEQAAGGYYTIALLALWVSRRHLFRLGLLLTGRSVDDATPWERREARLAAGLILAGATFLYFFCARTGMTPAIILLFFALYFLMAIAITRMRAELGPPSHDLYPVGAHRQIVSFLGAPQMGQSNPADLVMFGFLNFFNRVQRTHPMPPGMEGFRIAERHNMSVRRLYVAMWLSLVTGTLGMFWALVWAFNKYGMAAQVSVLPEVFSAETWDTVSNIWLGAPPKHQNGPLYATLIGLVFTMGLAMLRLSLTWWPLHPVGFALSASYTMGRIWLCVFIAWAVKALLLKYGGPRLYRPAVRFFVGLMLGDFIVGSFWYTYGIIMETDVYHFWPY